MAMYQVCQMNKRAYVDSRIICSTCGGRVNKMHVFEGFAGTVCPKCKHDELTSKM